MTVSVNVGEILDLDSGFWDSSPGIPGASYNLFCYAPFRTGTKISSSIPGND